jgi:hypothetical protein
LREKIHFYKTAVYNLKGRIQLEDLGVLIELTAIFK